MDATLFWLIRSAVFLGCSVPICIYATVKGGAPERAISSMTMVAIIATIVIPQHSYASVVVPLLVTDAALLVGTWMVALFANRYWVLYFVAVQLMTVALHGVRAYDPTILPDVYARLGGELAYPALLTLAIGTWRHRRRQPERDWSWQAMTHEI